MEAILYFDFLGVDDSPGGVGKGDGIVGLELSASSGLDFSIYRNITLLYSHCGFKAILHSVCKFEKLAESNRQSGYRYVLDLFQHCIRFQVKLAIKADRRNTAVS
jgi:hypothetical protein